MTVACATSACNGMGSTNQDACQCDMKRTSAASPLPAPSMPSMCQASSQNTSTARMHQLQQHRAARACTHVHTHVGANTHTCSETPTQVRAHPLRHMSAGITKIASGSAQALACALITSPAHEHQHKRTHDQPCSGSTCASARSTLMTDSTLRLHASISTRVLMTHPAQTPRAHQHAPAHDRLLLRLRASISTRAPM